MIPFGNNIVTLVRRVETKENGKTKVTYAQHVISGCSWKHKTIWQQVENASMQRGTEIVCRIPADQIAPKTGDYLFMGCVDVDATSTASLNAAIAAHHDNGVMRVASVSNNALPGFPLPHITARGNAP